MSTENIIILGIVVVIAFIIIRFLTKILAKLIAAAVVIAVLVYVLFYWNGGVLNFGKENFIIYDLEQKYCNEKKDHVKCDCIIQPLKEDIESRYTAKELVEINKDRIEALKILYKSIEDNREEIKQCLNENDRENAWEEFMEELKSSRIGKKLKKMLEPGDEKDLKSV